MSKREKAETTSSQMLMLLVSDTREETKEKKPTR